LNRTPSSNRILFISGRAFSDGKLARQGLGTQQLTSERIVFFKNRQLVDCGVSSEERHSRDRHGPEFDPNPAGSWVEGAPY
jgi:hypothetical protein